MAEPLIKRQKVEVWIYREDASRQGQNEGLYEYLVLLLIPERGGFWQPVTGGVELGEEIAHAALREAREETSLPFEHDVESLNASFTFIKETGPLAGVYEEHAFALEAPQGEKVRIDPMEHTAYRWVSAEEALKLMRFPENAAMLKILLKRHKTGALS